MCIRDSYNVRNKDDFNYWENNQYLGGAMKSMAVGSEPPASLEDLFT